MVKLWIAVVKATIEQQSEKVESKKVQRDNG